jgi:hypothetical protein
VCKIVVENLQNKNHFGYISVDGRVSYGVKRINLGEDKDQWQSLVNTVMNIRISQEMWNSVNSWVIITACIIENDSTTCLIGYVNACYISIPLSLGLINKTILGKKIQIMKLLITPTYWFCFLILNFMYKNSAQ